VFEGIESIAIPTIRTPLAALAALGILSCSPGPDAVPDAVAVAEDLHSYSNPAEVEVRHLAIDLTADFDNKELSGWATLEFSRLRGSRPMILDTRALRIEKVEVSADGHGFHETKFRLGETDPILGTPLEIELPLSNGYVRIHYRTTSDSTALQWLEPEQTAGKRHPFLYTQSEPIHARSWIPLQDTPAVKVPYSAHIRTPKGLRAVMSAGNRPDLPADGDYRFQMPNPVPSYLIALAVGDIEFRPLSHRTGVYAEPEVVEKAAREFEDTEKMLVAAERLFGRYRWGRYDILVLPPSFPFGGMENPRLTFATPTVLAGDKSLVSLIAHEMAHSWAGNLVTNATWRDFWLNEGFAVYLTRRIVEQVYGRKRMEMEALLGVQALREEMERLPESDQILHIDLKDRDPIDALTAIAYQKGALLLHTLEAAYGRERFDRYLRAYFDQFAFRSITTADFQQDLQYRLLNRAEPAFPVPVKQWLYEPGIPDGAWMPPPDVFAHVDKAAEAWLEGELPASRLDARGWSTQEWLRFLRAIPPDAGAGKLAQLDRAYHLTQTGNAEILGRWLKLAIQNGYERAMPRLRWFLTTQGRRKFVAPLFEELAKTPEGKKRALAIYREARPLYHPITREAVDKTLGWTESSG